MIGWAALFAYSAEAARGARVIPAGEAVRIESISKKDMFWRYRDELVGQVCLVGEPGLVRHRGKWYGGEITCADGFELFFFQVEVSRGDFGDAVLALTKRPPIAERDPAVPDAGAGAAPPPDGPFTGFGPTAPVAADWPVGARGRITAVSPADATHTRRASLLGRTCEVRDAPLSESGDAWLAGLVRCDGEDLFFFQVALDPVASAAAEGPGRKADGRLLSATLPVGERVRIVALAATDLYYTERDALIGQACFVAATPLVASGDGWYSGRLACGTAPERQFHQVAVAPD